MSGDNNNDVHIPMLFLFHTEGHALIKAWQEHAGLQVMMTDKVMIFGKLLNMLVQSDQSLHNTVLCLGQDFWGTQVTLYLNFRGTFTNSGGHTNLSKFLPVKI